MKLFIQKGISNYITHIFVQDSSSTTGAGLTGLTAASSGLKVGYMRPGATAFTVATPVGVTTLGTFAGTVTASAITGVDATNAPGLYEFHLPNNALTTTANNCVLMLSGANNMAPVVMEIQLVGFDPNASTVNAVTSNQTMSANVVLWGAASPTGLVSGNVPASLSGNTIVASANVTKWGAVSVNGPTGGLIQTDVIDWGSASVNGVMTGSIQVIAATVNDKTNYSISGSSIASANVVLWGAASPSGLLAGGVPIASNVKKSQTYNSFAFLMVATPSSLPITGLKAPTLQRSIDGGAFATGALSGFAEVGNGIYVVNFGAADLAGGTITFRAATAGASDTLVTLITSP